MKESRTYYTIKNTIYGYIASAVTLIVGFVSRYVFIHYLGVEYLGVSGLFSNVLGVLSFAELGFGTAINFSLYKPVAGHDREKIKSLMFLYRKVYFIIAGVVATIGVVLIPFLGIIIKNPGNVGSMRDITVYYIIFLVNTVVSYLVSYKYSLANAEQKSYLQTNIDTGTAIFTSLVQIVCILFYHNFFLYLLIGLVTNLLQKIFVSFYLNKKYPVLTEKDCKPLETETSNKIKKDVKGLIFHRIGEISVYQTDNIIVSAFISLSQVGKIANYTMIIDAISKFTNSTFNSVIASFGNLIALESTEKQNKVFNEYRFIGFWVYGFCSIMLYTFLTPFITFVFGNDLGIDGISVALICLDFYLRGHRICVNNVKTAGGIFYQDRYVAFMQAGINIVVSIALVRVIGLPGVYIGTVMQGLLSNIVKPYFVYRDIFKTKPTRYYTKGIYYLTSYLTAAVLCHLIRNIVIVKVSFGSLFLMFVIALISINGVFFIFNFRCEEFKYVVNKIKNILKKRN